MAYSPGTEASRGSFFSRRTLTVTEHSLLGPSERVRALGALARALADGPHELDSVFAKTCETLASNAFGFRRAVVFREVGRGEIIPVAQCGFPRAEILHGRLAPLDEWPLFRRAREGRVPASARDAQVEGDIPVEIAGSLGIRSAVAIPFAAGAACEGFVLCDRECEPFELDDGALAALAVAANVIAGAAASALALAETRRLSELKSQFVALASHELRAPVAGIHGITVTLRERGDELTPEQVSLLRTTLYEQADRMRRLVDQLLDVSRLDANAVPVRLERFGVRPRVEALVREVAATREPEVKIEIPPELETVADPAAFDRIVANLVTNAFRYGRPPVTISAQQLDTHFRLWVEDRGEGVPDDFAPRLFERFARAQDGARDGGSGLGLAIAQSYANAHGGRLIYEGAKPNGARFQLVLPTHGRKPSV
jgi:signal transduction histidine kinase